MRFDNQASSNATVVEVHAPDRIGLLHDITDVFAEMQLDIRHARIVTLGDNVVDTFYLREQNGAQITGVERSQLVEQSLLRVLGYPETA